MTIHSTRLLSLGLALTLAACGDDAKDNGTDDTGGAGDDTTGGDDTNVTGCDAEFDESVPEDGDTTFFVRDTFIATFDDTVESATFNLWTGTFDADNLPGDSDTPTEFTPTFDEDGEVATYTFTEGQLSPSSDYTISIDYDCGTEFISFTTSAAGTPVTDAETAIEGNTYIVDLGTLNIIEPAGLGSTLSSLLGQLGDSTLGLEIEDVDLVVMPNEMTVAGGLINGTSFVWDDCADNFTFPEKLEFDNPFFTFDTGSEGLTLNVQDFEITIGSAALSGAFLPDGSGLVGVSLSGDVDVRDLGDVLSSIGADDPDSACTVISGFGVDCEECQSDGEPYCLGLVATGIQAAAETATCPAAM